MSAPKKHTTKRGKSQETEEALALLDYEREITREAQAIHAQVHGTIVPSQELPPLPQETSSRPSQVPPGHVTPPVVPSLNLNGQQQPTPVVKTVIAERSLKRVADNTTYDYTDAIKLLPHVEISVGASPQGPAFVFVPALTPALTLLNRDEALTKAIESKQALKNVKSMGSLYGRVANKLVKSASIAKSEHDDVHGHLRRAMQAYKNKKECDLALRRKIEQEADEDLYGLLEDLHEQRHKTSGLEGFNKNLEKSRKRKRDHEQEHRQEQEQLNTARSAESNDTATLERRVEKLKGG